jgi:N utilization substance protein A
MAAINQLCTEKNIPKDRVLEIVQHAFRAAYRKDYGNREQNIEVVLNDTESGATILLVKDVVKKKDLENEHTQISVEEAKKSKPDAKVGDVIKIDVTPADYGRIAAQSAKQVIIQRLQEAEKEIVHDIYKDREHEILSGFVNRVEGKNVYVDLERTQAILYPKDQIPGEKFHSGQRIKVYLEKCAQTPKGPQLLVSRSHPKLVECFLEMEIPEIKDGIVEIISVAREPGVRTKVAVRSTDQSIDPIGACVGQKGVRIQNIMDEFNGERIDIIEWKEDQKAYLEKALSPAKITYIDLDEKEKRAGVYVAEEERALAIGKSGQNVRLASKLTGWEIDILDLDKLDTAKLDELKKKEVDKKMKGEEPEKTVISAEKQISELDLDDGIIEKLESAGFIKVVQLQGLNVDALMAIENIDQKDAEKVEKAVQECAAGGGEAKKEKEEKKDESSETSAKEEEAPAEEEVKEEVKKEEKEEKKAEEPKEEKPKEEKKKEEKPKKKEKKEKKEKKDKSSESKKKEETKKKK